MRGVDGVELPLLGTIASSKLFERATAGGASISADAGATKYSSTLDAECERDGGVSTFGWAGKLPVKKQYLVTASVGSSTR